ncbi:MAG: hypothetical protein JNJ89_09285 [Rubrivivax sp.]|nr:hypothetical protein [Rubrivivax sp.]
MAFITALAPAAARDDVARIYRSAQAHWGYVPEHTQVFCHRPAVLTQWHALLAEVKRPMDKRRYELVTFVAARAYGNSPCSLVHGGMLREFFTDSEVVALAEGRFEDALDDADALLAHFARRVAVSAAQITAADIEALRGHGFADAELFDVAAAVGVRAFFTRVLDAMGVLPDAPWAQLPARLREALTAGREIGTGPCLAMPAEDGRTPGASAGR